ncbi:hypothetical protein [Olivibacter sitiensis]|uniref:hypothetical protein n=1 Tax=Olivibacter sitiensis TaxID=376470 RepID=UPI0012F9E7E4|nr:hypothetical protein [Olivibacter sitiensis]
MRLDHHAALERPSERNNSHSSKDSTLHYPPFGGGRGGIEHWEGEVVHATVSMLFVIFRKAMAKHRSR